MNYNGFSKQTYSSKDYYILQSCEYYFVLDLNYNLQKIFW